MVQLDAISLGVTLIVVGAVFFLAILLLVRLVPRIRPSARTEQPEVTPANITRHSDAVLVVQPGGRIKSINEPARQLFNLQGDELPGLERLARRTRPAEAFLGLCSSEGTARFLLEGRLVDSISYTVQDGAESLILIIFRPTQLLPTGDDNSMLSSQALRSILQLNQAIAASLDLNATILAILKNLGKLAPADYLELAVWDDDQHQLVPYRYSTLGDDERPLVLAAERYSLGEGFGGLIAERRTSLFIPDVAGYVEHKPADELAGTGFRAYIGVPLEVENELVGVLAIGATTAHAFRQEDADLVDLLAGQAAIAVHNAQLYKEEQRRANEMAGLGQLAQAFGALTDPKDLFQRLVQSIVPLVPVRILGFLLYDEAAHTLRGQAPFHGLPEQFMTMYHIPVNVETLLPHMFDQDILITENALEDGQWAELGLNPMAVTATLRDTVLMPLASGGRTIGYLQASNHLDGSVVFTQDELSLLRIIANQAAPVIENANLIQQSRLRTQRAEALRRIASLASSAATLDEILKFSIQELARLLRADVGFGFLLAETSGELRLHLPSLFGAPAEAAHRIGHVSLEDPQYPFTTAGSMRILATGQVAGERALPPFYRTLVDQFSLISLVVVPLVARDRGVGELWFGSLTADYFDRGDMQVVATAAGQLAGAVEQSYLATQTDEDLRRRVDQLTALTRISRELSNTLDLDFLMQSVYDEIMRLSNAAAGTIVLFAPDCPAGQPRQIEHVVGMLPDEAQLDLSWLDLVPALAFKLIDPLASSARAYVLEVPVYYRDNLAGLIHLQTLIPGQFDHALVEIIQALAVQMSIALGNVLQYQALAGRGEQLNRQVSVLTKLQELSGAVNPNLPLAQSLEMIAAAIQQVTPFQVVLISACQSETLLLERICAAGIEPAVWEDIRTRRPSWAGVQALLKPEFLFQSAYFIPVDQRPLVLPEVHLETILPVRAGQAPNAWDAQDMLLVPLLDHAGNPLGLISVDAPRDSHRPDRLAIEAVEILAGQAATIIETYHRTTALNQQVSDLRVNLGTAEKLSGNANSLVQGLQEKEQSQGLVIREVSRQARRLRSGLEIAGIASRQPDVDSLVAVLAREMLVRFDFDLCLVAENVPSGPHIMTGVGAIPETVNPEALLGQRNPLRQVLGDGQLVLVHNLDEAPDWHNTALLNALEAQSFICLPLVVQDKALAAVLAVSKQSAPAFTEEDRQVFQQLGRQVSISLQNLVLLTSTRQRLQEVNLLLDFSLQLGSLDPGSILTTLVETALNVIPAAQAGMVALWDAKGRQLVPQAASGYVDNRSVLEMVYPLDSTRESQLLPVRAYLHGKSLRVDEVNFASDYNLPAENLIRYRQATGGRLPVSSLLVPIRAGEVTLGIIVLENYAQAAAFEEEDEALAASLTQQTALALENARLFLASEQRAMQLEALTTVTGTLTSSLQRDQLVASLLSQLEMVIPYNTATLWMLAGKSSQTGAQMTVLAANGFLDSDQRIGLTVEVRDSLLLNEMIRTGQPISVPDVRLDERFPSLVELEYRSWLGFPLMAKGDVIGVIALEKAEASFYTREHIQVGTTFAGQAAVALDNARLFEESIHRAVELDQRSQRLALLNRLSSDLSGSLDASRIIALATQQIQAALAGTTISTLLAESTGSYSLCVEVPPTDLPMPEMMPRTRLFERLEESLGVFITADVTLEPEISDMADFFARRQVHSLMAVPLAAANQLQGIFLVQVDYPYRFSSAEIELALTISNQTAIALQNARLYAETVRLTEELEQRVKERTAELLREHLNTETLLNIIMELSASLDIDQVLNRTLAVLNNAVSADQSVVFLVRSGPLTPYYRAGMERSIPGKKIQVHQVEAEIARAVYKKHQAILVTDVFTDERWKVGDEPPEYQSFLCVPLVLGEETLGSLMLHRKQPLGFDSGQVNLVEAAARQIGVSLSNAELYNLIRDQAENLGSMLREQQVEASRSRAILEAVADGVLVTDASNRISLFNQSAERILGLPASDVLRQSLDQFAGAFSKSARSWFQTIRLWTSDSKSNQPGDTFSDQITLDNGRVVAINLAPVFLRSQFLGSVSIFRDITHEVQVDRLKSEFVANVSHELRTPMTSIKGYVDVMLMGATGSLNEQQTRFLQVVRNNTQRLNVLVNDLLDVSRVEAGRAAMTFEPLNLEELLQEVIDDLKRRSQEENKAMNFHLESQPGLKPAMGDQERIRQVINNLMANAYNYTPAHGHVTIQLLPLEHEAQINVIDSGVGIAPGQQARIFERFYRGDDPLVLATAGTGLGLSISKTLIEMHHGKIWFSSSGKPGEGSTFSFTLPWHQAVE